MTTQLTPYLGMPVTETIGSDSYGGVITSVTASGKTFTFVTLDNVGFGEEHEYTDAELVLMRRSDAYTIKVTKRKDGRWRISKSNIPVSLGKAYYRRDPSF